MISICRGGGRQAGVHGDENDWSKLVDILRIIETENNLWKNLQTKSFFFCQVFKSHNHNYNLHLWESSSQWSSSPSSGITNTRQTPIPSNPSEFLLPPAHTLIEWVASGPVDTSGHHPPLLFPPPPSNPPSPVSPFLYLLTKPITLFLYYLCPRLISTTSYSGLENELFMIYCCKKLEGPAICFFSHSVPSRSVKTFLYFGKQKQSHHNHNIFPNFDLLYVMMSPYDI